MEDFWSGDVWAVLENHPDTRQYCADPHFRAAIDDVRADSTQLQKYFNDPRVVQATTILMGQEVIVTEDDLRAAERGGHMPRRSPVQLAHREAAAALADPVEAKDCGNKHFQSGDHGLALACYERCVELLGDSPSDLKSIAYSNAAAVHLKLKFYREAEECCSKACESATPTTSLAKPLYRRALAREQLGRARFEDAIADLKSAMDMLRKEGQAAELKKVEKDLNRLEQATGHRKQLQTEESKAEVLRKAGASLQAKPAAPASKDGYVKEMDFSFTTKKRLKEVLAGVYTHVKGCRVALRDMVDAPSKVSVSVMTKRGQRSLYYDFDLLFAWEGTSKKGRATEGSFGGYIRLYNIGQDTKFELGGLPETSWMYSLGFKPEHQASVEPWVEDIKATANDLFEPIAVRIRQVIKELHAL
eukprot:GGOE01020347.1.p1 GENE.GGOE01020347.1~~GGOE01020347.1.p1  ORF type:complete len:440 (-),score=109.99 GGOE01020347.1:160-1410(-)